MSRSVSPKRDDKKSEEKRFLNGWTKEQEQLMAEWSDIALCYRWLHDNAEKIYHYKNLWINLPVIILTTLGGTASFGVQSIFANDQTMKEYASFAIGGVSLFAGILTTVGNYLRYAQLEEANRVASIAWGKFQRLIAVELAINPNERIDAMDFLKICRADLDRLIEQSPPIPNEAISVFESKFGGVKQLKKPDICGSLEHTNVFDSNETRLKQVAVDATMLMKQRRATLNELLSPQIQETIDIKVNRQVQEAILQKRKEFEVDKLELNKLITDRTEPRREGREGREAKTRVLVRPSVHKMEYHPVQVKAVGGDTTREREDNVIVIPEIEVPLSSHPQMIHPALLLNSLSRIPITSGAVSSLQDTVIDIPKTSEE